MNTPSRKTGERTLAATSAADSGTYLSPNPCSRNASTASSQAPSCAGAALTDSDPAFVNQASMPCVAQKAPTSSTAASIASPICRAPTGP